MSFSAIGMNAPGLASAAPAPTIATIGDEATFSICVEHASVRFGFGGRRSDHTTKHEQPQSEHDVQHRHPRLRRARRLRGRGVPEHEGGHDADPERRR